METSEMAGILLGQPAEDAAPETEAPQAEASPEQETVSSAEDSETPETSETPEGEPEAEAPQAKTLKEKAAELNIPVSDFYDLELGDGLTIGQLKDRMQELSEADELRKQATLHKTQVENELMQRRRELAVTAQNLGREPTPQEQEQARRAYEDYVSHETTLVMQAIPDWSDTAKAETDRTAIIEMLGEYGFSDVEIGATVDHRQIKMLRDYAALRKLVSGAGEEVKPKANQKPRRSRRRAQTGADDIVRKYGAGEIGQSQAIASLIADGARK